METITFKYKVQPLVQKWLHHMPTFSWVIWKKNPLAHVSFSKAAHVAPWSQKDLHEFLDKAYTFHKTIKYTSEISNDNRVFLDTKSHIEGSQLVKDLYSKQTDSHQYLPQTSCHPRHCCKDIPYSLALRIRRICSQEAHYERRTHELSSHLCRCGYKSKNVDKAITKASSIQRNELLKYKSNTIHNTFYSNVPPWSPKNTRHWQALANHWNKHKAQMYFPLETNDSIQTTKKPQRHPRQGKGQSQRGVKAVQYITLSNMQIDTYCTDIQIKIWDHLHNKRMPHMQNV